MAKAKKPAGRPTKYRTEYAQAAYEFALVGATDKQLAEMFGVNPDTIVEWRKVHPEFSESVRAGKLVADAKVAKALFERATGYQHDAVKIFMPAGATAPVYAPYVEHFAPDTAALQFWLKNRQPEIWRDKVSAELTGADGGPLQVMWAANPEQGTSDPSGK